MFAEFGIFIFLIILFLSDGQNETYGGGDISSSIKDIKDPVEVEIKIKNPNLIRRIMEWLKGKITKRENTTNYIWADNIINQVAEDGTSTWYKKTKIYNKYIDLGDGAGVQMPNKLTVAVEKKISNPGLSGSPILVRKKNRESIKINKYWRLDLTYINDKEMPEVEFEYVAKDAHNAIGRIKAIESFIGSL